MRSRIHRRVQSLHHLNTERIRTWMKVQKPWHQPSAFKGKFASAPWSELYMSCCIHVLGRASEERTGGRRVRLSAEHETGYGEMVAGRTSAWGCMGSWWKFFVVHGNGQLVDVQCVLGQIWNWINLLPVWWYDVWHSNEVSNNHSETVKALITTAMKPFL